MAHIPGDDVSESNIPGMQMPFVQKCISILWPSFLVAIVATGLFFSAFNPRELYPFDIDIEVSTLGAYTVGFFVFWALSALSSTATLYFAITNCRKIHADLSNSKHH
jgi:hypothetical protein